MDKISVGEMCYFEFNLCEIKETKDGNVTEISDGYMRYSAGSGFNDRCFPVTLPNKLISDEYYRWSMKIYKEGLSGLNYPDIHRWLVQHWADTCCLSGVKEGFESRYKELREFGEYILTSCQNIKQKQTKFGIFLWRQ